jgi:hypothetical protein
MIPRVLATMKCLFLNNFSTLHQGETTIPLFYRTWRAFTNSRLERRTKAWNSLMLSWKTSVTYLELIEHGKVYDIVCRGWPSTRVPASACNAFAGPELYIHHCSSVRRNALLFSPAFQESMSLKELDINFPLVRGPSNLALESMLKHTQSLRSLSLVCPDGVLEDIAVAAAASD